MLKTVHLKNEISMSLSILCFGYSYRTDRRKGNRHWCGHLQVGKRLNSSPEKL